MKKTSEAKHIVSLSGGKDSTAMLLMMLEKDMPVDYIIFVDTTKEFPQIYEHLEKLERYISPLKITRVAIPFDYYFSEHVRKKGKKKGTKGYGFANIRSRWCTSFKRDYFTKKVRELIGDTPYIRYIGYAYDEYKRYSKNNGKHINELYPLVEWKITEKQALEYCYSKGFDFGGLYEVISRSSCYCCPLVSMKKLYAIYKHYPDLFEKIKEMELKSPNKFKPNLSIFEIEEKFKKMYAQEVLL